MCKLLLEHISIWTSCISSVQKPHVARWSLKWAAQVETMKGLVRMSLTGQVRSEHEMVASAAPSVQVRWDMRMRKRAREGGTSLTARRERPGRTHDRQPQGRGSALMLVTKPERVPPTEGY